MSEMNAVATWGSVCVTLIFGLLSIYFYLKSRRFRQVICTYESTTLQSKAHPDVEITFRGESVINLTRTIIALWNGGTDEIRAGDIPNGVYPKIKLETTARILSATVLATSKPNINFSIAHTSGSTVIVTFDYLNPADGGVLEVLSERPARRTIDVDATIIGGRDPLLEHYEPPRPMSDRLVLILGPLGFMLFGLYALYQGSAP